MFSPRLEQFTILWYILWYTKFCSISILALSLIGGRKIMWWDYSFPSSKPMCCTTISSMSVNAERGKLKRMIWSLPLKTHKRHTADRKHGTKPGNLSSICAFSDWLVWFFYYRHQSKQLRHYTLLLARISECKSPKLILLPKT